MIEELRRQLRQICLDQLSLAAEDVPAFGVEHPARPEHGDLATNLAMALARPMRRAPRELAARIQAEVLKLPGVERCEVAGPGFINVFYGADHWRQVLPRILEEGPDFGRTRPKVAERVQIEFVSANPTGPLHFGHGRGAAVGDVLARLLQFAGHTVEREFYVNDAGAQVRNLALSVVARLRELRGLPAQFPADGYRGDYVVDLARRLPPELCRFLPGEPDEAALQAIMDFGVEQNLADIRQVLDAFGVRMERYASEREVFRSGRLQQVFAELAGQGAIEDREGARWFAAERFGDEKPRVLVKSDGSHTYFATDLAYHLDKLRRGFERLINVWGADHHGYVPRMKAGLKALGHPPDKLEVVLVQMVSLVRGGEPVVMSKRAGEIITLREVIEEVGSDAARFFFLLRSPDGQMEFDLELAKKRSLDNPVFYVQYGHARLCSILARAAERGLPVPLPSQVRSANLARLEHPLEIDLLKTMARFPEAVAAAVESRAPQLLVAYLMDLAGRFHHYYTVTARESPILAGDPERLCTRLLWVQALRQVMRNALGLLGVSAPERMDQLPGEEAAG